VTFEDKNGTVSELEVDKVLVATGREPAFEQAQATRAGIDLTGPFIKVNDHFATSLPGVFAIGDAVGGMMLAHKASAEAEAVIQTILGKKTTIDSHMIPRCIWGPAEIGSVGMSEEEALATGRKIKTGRFPCTASGAALAMGNAEGFVKIVGDADSGEILGTHIIGEHATDLISEAVTVMKMEGVVEDLYEAIKPHPTLSETLMEAALDWNKMAIHMPKRR
jgi:dihydrolipoamide dehydrogenase